MVLCVSVQKKHSFFLSLHTSSFFDRSQDKRNEKMGLYTSIVVNFQYISIFAVVASAFLMILYTLRMLSMVSKNHLFLCEEFQMQIRFFGKIQNNFSITNQLYTLTCLPKMIGNFPIFLLLFRRTGFFFYMILSYDNFQDLLNAFPGGVVRVPQTSHRINMEQQTLDVVVTKIFAAKESIRLRLKVNSSQLVTLRAYWGVDVSTFFHVLR